MLSAMTRLIFTFKALQADFRHIDSSRYLKFQKSACNALKVKINLVIALSMPNDSSLGTIESQEKPSNY